MASLLGLFKFPCLKLCILFKNEKTFATWPLLTGVFALETQELNLCTLTLHCLRLSSGHFLSLSLLLLCPGLGWLLPQAPGLLPGATMCLGGHLVASTLT